MLHVYILLIFLSYEYHLFGYKALTTREYAEKSSHTLGEIFSCQKRKYKSLLILIYFHYTVNTPRDISSICIIDSMLLPLFLRGNTNLITGVEFLQIASLIPTFFLVLSLYSHQLNTLNSYCFEE